MANPRDDKKPQDTRQADAERELTHREPASVEPEEGLQGYGEAPKDVREHPLPDQGWGRQR